MKTYLVFEPGDGGRDAETAERTIFVREKFIWSALFFTPIWLLWHRLWLGFVVWFAANALIGILAYALDIHSMVAGLASALPSLIVAFEGAALRRRKLLRCGYREAGTVLADDLEGAERRFFAEWASRTDVRQEVHVATRPQAPPSPPLGANPVIGLFPEPGGGR